ncbi:MAG: hypothetical protein RR696_05195 [Clostridia bacterium]
MLAEFYDSWIQLYEETGAKVFTLAPVCVYSVTDDGCSESFWHH